MNPTVKTVLEREIASGVVKINGLKEGEYLFWNYGIQKNDRIGEKVLFPFKNAHGFYDVLLGQVVRVTRNNNHIINVEGKILRVKSIIFFVGEKNRFPNEVKYPPFGHHQILLRPLFEYILERHV